MKFTVVMPAVMVALTLAGTVSAQTTATPTAPVSPPSSSATPPSNEADPNAFQRNVYQQNRVENGMKDGRVSTGEASQLERGESHIDQMERHDEHTGMTPQEMQNLEKAQNKESQEIRTDNRNSVEGNPQSASSQRMQTDVQRDSNQQTRINSGVENGSLTRDEAAASEHGQSASALQEANKSDSGRITAAGQAKVQATQNQQSRRIYHRKHNNVTAPPKTTEAK